MAQIIVMPKLSDTMEEGVIAKWLKKEGDGVKEGDLLAEIETDKATMEYESPAKGVVLKLIAAPGKKLALKEPICVIGEKGESYSVSDAKPAADKPAEKEAAKATTKPQAKASPLPPPGSDNKRLRASPLAKKIAGERGVDLTKISGSGPQGRVVMRDVSSLKGEGGSGLRVVPGISAATTEDRLVPVTMMRQTIAKRLLAAKNNAPHFYLTVSCSMIAINNWRKKLNDEAAKSAATPKVSVNDIILLASAKALRKHPDINASWEDENIRIWGNVHMAMAVALPTGLITPVIRNCDALSVRQIAVQTSDLAKRAKAGSLKPEDYTGGTFTVSNLGMLGIEEFTAIINPPQSAILAVGKTSLVPSVNDAGQVVAEPRMRMTMSCDHRVIDGAMGALYLQTLVQYLEDPMMMLA